MNTGTLVITAVLVIICVLPFVLMALGRRKKKKQLLQLVYQIPEAQNSSLTHVEYCGDILVCMDAQERYVFFAKNSKNKKQSWKCVDLHTVVRCEPFKQSRSVKGDGGSYTVIDRLELRFFSSKNANDFVRLTFYNANKNLQPTSELEVINRWAEMINSAVELRKKRNRQ